MSNDFDYQHYRLTYTDVAKKIYKKNNHNDL